MTKTAITYDNVLAHVTANAASAVGANFKALAAGSMAYLVGFVWADKDGRKPAADIKADILRCFAETGDKKSKRYEFAGLCLTIARDLGKGHDWGNELRQQEDVESGVDFLAARFGSVAGSVAALALHFGTARSAGQKKEKGFMESLESLLDKAAESGESVPVGAAVFHLLAIDQPSVADGAAIIGKIVATWDSANVADLMESLNDMLAHRVKREAEVAQLRTEEAEEAEMDAAKEPLAAQLIAA